LNIPDEKALEYDLKVSGDGKSFWLLCSWTLSIVLSLSKKTALFFPQNATFRKLGSVSVLRQNLLCWAQLTELIGPKCSVLRKKQDGFLDKDKTMDNVQEHSNHMLLNI
jgi:hypothetical protein